MAIIRVTKEFRFEMAHVLQNYDGPCRNVHGHSYVLYVTLSGKPVDDTDRGNNGMVIDFGELKKIVEQEITEKFDHSIVVAGYMPAEKLAEYKKLFENIIITPYQPTCENLVAGFADVLLDKFPEGVTLHSLKLYETATAFAEWYASDNHR
jgi:6-pyruvoyltetrahydropterin/6-carboxytetrahydropterin synthase